MSDGLRSSTLCNNIIIIIIITIIISSLSLHYNSEITERELRHSRDHVPIAEKLQPGWLFPLYPRQQSRIQDCLRFLPGDPDNDRVGYLGEKMSYFGPELSALPRDYCSVLFIWIRIFRAEFLWTI